MKPIIKYRGGKSKEIPNFIQFIPQNYDRYVEPFLGGAALYFYLEPHTALINDINDKLINFYLSVRNNFNALRKELTASLKVSVLKKTLNALNYYLKAPNIVIVHRFLIKTQLKQERIQNG